jgi:hypothetical protein
MTCHNSSTAFHGGVIDALEMMELSNLIQMCFYLCAIKHTRGAGNLFDVGRHAGIGVSQSSWTDGLRGLDSEHAGARDLAQRPQSLRENHGFLRRDPPARPPIADAWRANAGQLGGFEGAPYSLQDLVHGL